MDLDDLEVSKEDLRQPSTSKVKVNRPALGARTSSGKGKCATTCNPAMQGAIIISAVPG